jgi:hypothetical protein
VWKLELIGNNPLKSGMTVDIVFPAVKVGKRPERTLSPS